MRWKFSLATAVVLAMMAGGVVGPATPSSGTDRGTVDVVVLVDARGRWHVPRQSVADYTFFYGNPGDVPLLGDWDGDGTDTPGVFRPSNGRVYLTNSLPRDGTTGMADKDLTFFFGSPGDEPLVGDWDGDGVDTLGIRRRDTVFLTNSHATGVAEAEFVFGIPGDVAVGGDADGDGADGVFLYRPAGSMVYYATDWPAGPGAVAPTAGAFSYGISGDRLVVGDWDGDGIDTVGVFRPFESRVYLRNTNTRGPADTTYEFGESTWVPVAGRVIAGSEPDPGLPIRINVGGPALPTIDTGPDWQEDSADWPSPFVNFTADDPGNRTATWPVPELDISVPPGTPPQVFATERYDNPGNAAMHWYFPVPANQLVEVRLFFASGFAGASQIAERLFDVAIDDWQVLDDYDIVADVGHGMGVMKRFIVETDSDGLDIAFAHLDPAVQNPLINAIEIRTPERVRVVEASGLALDNGRALRQALAEVATHGPGSDTPWVVKLLPGIFDVGDVPLSLLPYVEVEGSGELATMIMRTGTTPEVSVPDDGVLRGVDHSTLRHLTVYRPPGGDMRLSSRGIVNIGGAPRLESVTVEVEGHNVEAIMTEHHIGARLLDVTLHCHGGPSWSTCLRQTNGGTLRASNLTMTGSVRNPGILTGIEFVFSPVAISNARIDLSGPGVVGAAGGKGELTMHRASVSLDGSFRGTTGFRTTIGGVNLTDVTIHLQGWGADTTGIHVEIGSATLERVGIQVTSGDSPTGISTNNASLTLADVEILAHENVYNTGWGIDLGEGGYDLATVTGSSITAPSSTVRSVGTSAEIQNSTLAGGPVIGTEFVTCTDVWDEHGTFYPDSCPD